LISHSELKSASAGNSPPTLVAHTIAP
jgi:hypothetical protein